MSAPETTSKIQEPTYKDLDSKEVLSRLQDVYNHLACMKLDAPMHANPEAQIKHYGYLQRGVLEAKRIIKEGQK